jgi:3-hydroxy-9,10-secoandrosta-1,3,5(10)-triene-9,17-dione monooxygenase reductase component
VTVVLDGHAHGMVIGSFCSLSATPPLVMFSAGTTSRTHDLVNRAGHFAVSILSERHDIVFERFAGFDRTSDADRFAGLTTITAVTGAPILLDSLAWVDCRVVESHPGATYTIFVGEILAAGLGTSADVPPLIYYRRQRRHLAAVAP